MWYIWLILFLVFIGIEIITTGIFFFLCFSVGALFAMMSALLGFDYQVAIVVFCVVSVLSVLLIRPFLKIYFKKRNVGSNVDSLIGTKTQVLENIGPNAPGKIKVEGEVWLAVSKDNQTFSVGQTVEIVSVDGTKLIVKNAE